MVPRFGCFKCTDCVILIFLFGDRCQTVGAWLAKVLFLHHLSNTSRNIQSLVWPFLVSVLRVVDLDTNLQRVSILPQSAAKCLDSLTLQALLCDVYPHIIIVSKEMLEDVDREETVLLHRIRGLSLHAELLSKAEYRTK